MWTSLVTSHSLLSALPPLSFLTMERCSWEDRKGGLFQSPDLALGETEAPKEKN